GLALLVLIFPVPVTAQNVSDGYAPAVDGPVVAIAVQADGKTLIGGYFTQVNGIPCSRVCRLRADGGVDQTFVDPGINAPVWAIAIQPDGRVVVGGEFTQVGGQLRTRVARLHPNGGLDASFINPD